MLLDELILIKGIGKFTNYIVNSPISEWDGKFSKITAIYAENASGKTTFTQILKSLSSTYEISDLRKRKTFDYTGVPSIVLKSNKHVNDIAYNGTDWNVRLGDNIEVFDSYYIDENVYVISLTDRKKVGADMSVILGDNVQLYKDLEELKAERNRLSSKKSGLTKKVREETRATSVRILKNQIIQVQMERDQVNQKIKILEKQLTEQTEHSQYILKINDFLKIFAPYLQLTKLNRKSNNVFVYGLKIGEHFVRSSKEEDINKISLKHILSEGEKNILALSFFLAKLSLMKNISNQLVVFDDPISSMDSMRRQATLNRLSYIAEQAEQFIVLSHDKLFINDFKRKNENALVLKICKGKGANFINTYDIQDDTKTGIYKDISILKQYVELGDSSKYTPREVVRCIRPVIEGYLRLKYSALDLISDKKMLGSIITEIEQSSNPILSNTKKYISELRDINNYSQNYHHSNPHCLENPICESELRVYCERTLDLLMKI